jgi:hypothetical protein
MNRHTVGVKESRAGEEVRTYLYFINENEAGKN